MDIHAADALHAGIAPAAEPVHNDPIAPDIETASDGYARRFSGPAGAFLLGEQTAAVASLLDRLPPLEMRVLEVGGGHAQLTTLFAARGHSVTVHGSSNACFPRVQPAISRHPGRVHCMLGSLQQLPAHDREYDLVCSIRLLGHYESWQALLAEKCRVAGRYVMCEFATQDGVQRLAKVLFRMKVRMEPDTRSFRAFAQEEIDAELRRNGFRTLFTVRQLVLPIALHRKISSPAVSRAAESMLKSLGLTRVMGSPMILLAERVGAEGSPSGQ